MTTTTVDPLAYYAAHGCALFPIPAGSKEDPGWKNGTGIIKHFSREWSRDPSAWAAWREAHPNCNFGVVAAPSQLMIADIDVTEVGEAVAWQHWCAWWQSRNLSVPMPQCRSARGGWHVLFALGDGSAKLRQVPLIGVIEGVSKKPIVDMRIGNGYVVAAGSYYDGKPYQLLSDTPPHSDASFIEALTAACGRAQRGNTTAKAGQADPGDVRNVVEWMVGNGCFQTRDDWIRVGMILRTELGDDAGLPIFGLVCHNGEVDETALYQWNSFSVEPDPDSVKLGTLVKWSKDAGCHHRIRQNITAMFGSLTPVQLGMTAPLPPPNRVAELAANVGATLAGPLPPPQGMPMDGGQAELTRLSTPILEEFLAATADAPSRPSMADIPTLPPQMSGHGLYALLNDTIVRVLALTEQPKFKPSRCTAALSVLYVAHKDLFESVKRRVETIGRTLADSKIKLAAKALEDQVQRAFVRQDDWVYDQKGLPESDNPDNVVAALGIIGAEVRWNAWLNRAEIQGFEWPTWVAIDDVVIAKLKMRFLRTGTRFRVGNEFLRESLLAIAHANQFDPVIERIDSLVWDRSPRLVTWLSYTCGVPCDPYHQAVGKNVIGGMVKRARTPGAKHDEVMILIGKQGTAKSTLCRTLALSDEWFTDSVAFDGSPQNIVPQLFGKLVVELAELDGMAKKEVQHIKAFITRQSDNVTLKYKAFASDFSRRCVFIGTSNEDSPLVDITGNRRFLPVRVESEINLPWLRDNIEQMVAEAAHLHRQGADFAIPKSVWGDAAEHQEAARSVSDIELCLSEWFAETLYTATAFVATVDLIELGNLAGWRTVHASLRNTVMKRLGFRQVMPYIAGVKTRGWLRGPDMLPKHIEHVTRYLVGKTQEGRPRVTPRGHNVASERTATALNLPAPPLPQR